MLTHEEINEVIQNGQYSDVKIEQLRAYYASIKSEAGPNSLNMLLTDRLDIAVVCDNEGMIMIVKRHPTDITMVRVWGVELPDNMPSEASDSVN